MCDGWQSTDFSSSEIDTYDLFISFIDETCCWLQYENKF